MNINYWHMQMHPDDQSFSDEKVFEILEHNKIIGLGSWEKGKTSISDFRDTMKVNDVVAIKNGAKLIALVQVIGGSYEVHDDLSELGWIKNRRPVRVLDWELNGAKLPQPLGTLNICLSDVETTRIIKSWHDRVIISFKKRKIAAFV